MMISREFTMKVVLNKQHASWFYYEFFLGACGPKYRKSHNLFTHKIQSHHDFIKRKPKSLLKRIITWLTK